jgi:hypothetical protein
MWYVSSLESYILSHVPFKVKIFAFFLSYRKLSPTHIVPNYSNSNQKGFINTKRGKKTVGKRRLHSILHYPLHIITIAPTSTLSLTKIVADGCIFTHKEGDRGAPILKEAS